MRRPTSIYEWRTTAHMEMEESKCAHVGRHYNMDN